jgi:hypothetical protein
VTAAAVFDFLLAGVAFGAVHMLWWTKERRRIRRCADGTPSELPAGKAQW